MTDYYTSMAFEFFDHTADVGVRVTAGSPGELIAEAVRAFYAILLEEGCRDRIEKREERAVDLSAPDGEAVVVDLLNELIYRFDSEHLLLPGIVVEELRLEAAGGRIRGRLSGERFDPERHSLSTEIKAATYHGLELKRSGQEISMEVIFDL